jgi:hypothetical protein
MDARYVVLVPALLTRDRVEGLQPVPAAVRVAAARSGREREEGPVHDHGRVDLGPEDPAHRTLSGGTTSVAGVYDVRVTPPRKVTALPGFELPFGGGGGDGSPEGGGGCGDGDSGVPGGTIGGRGP